MILLKDTHTRGVGNDRSTEMVNVIGSNYRRGVDAGRASLFAVLRLSPGATHREPYTALESARVEVPAFTKY